MITTKTVDRLNGMAQMLNSMSVAVHEEGWREEARELEAAAYRLALAAGAIDVKIAAGAAAMLKDDAA